MNSNGNTIKCDAKNCVHHTGRDTCMASCIKVGTCEACSCAETVCATFELNKSAVDSHG